MHALPPTLATQRPLAAQAELSVEGSASSQRNGALRFSQADAAPAPTDLTREITDPAALRVAEQKAKDAKAEAQRLKEQLSQSQDETQRAKQVQCGVRRTLLGAQTSVPLGPL